MTLRLPTNRLTRHLLFWAGVVVLAGATYILEDISNSGYFAHRVGVVADLFLARLPTFVVYTYLLTYWVLPWLFRGQFVRFFAGVLLLNLVRWFLNDLLTYSLKFPLMHGLHEELSVRPATWLFGSLFPGTTFWPGNVVAGLFICVKLFREWQQKQAESQQLEREKLQTELQLLKLELNPSFLFGSLRTLYHLTQQQAKQAPEIVLNLAHFLRYVLYENKAETVPLALEIDIIQHYVSLQRAMHPTDLEVSLTVRGDLASQVIPPYVLFPIVENAFGRLGLDRVTRPADEPAWVSIDLAVGQTHLTLKVVNGQPDSRTPADNSMDMAAIEKQLYFHYADAYAVEILSEADAFIVALTIPLVVTPMLVVPQSIAAYEPPVPDRR